MINELKCSGSVFVPTCRDPGPSNCSGSVFVPTCRDTGHGTCSGSVLYLPVETLDAVLVVVLCLYLPVEDTGSCTCNGSVFVPTCRDT